MSEGSKIEWTDHTFNPWWGCAKVSPGCANCYAVDVDKFRSGKGNEHWGVNAPRRFFGDTHWRQPLTWNRKAEAAGVPALVFCGSMCDVFEDRDDLVEHRQRLFDLIVATPWLTWQLLTKRPENVDRMVPTWWAVHEWPANVWLGTSVEDQRRANERIPRLLENLAQVRFLSCEPLLGPVDLRCAASAEVSPGVRLGVDYLAMDAMHVDWVIVGGESGPGARPMHPTWARSIRDQCVDAGVPFHFKQWGEWTSNFPGPAGWRYCTNILVDGTEVDMADDDGARMFRVGKKVAGRELDGRTWDQMPAREAVTS